MATISDNSIRAIKQRFGIVGESPALIAAIRRAMLVAPIDLSVLIIGESGSGKEHFPKIIHESGSRKHKKYIAVNCGAIPEGTIDSELFGHVKGSFTGAIADHKGYFEEADGGVIFLDEVAEMPMSTQARLLRVLENGEYLRVGDSTVRKTNIRVVAATNKDMLKAVKDGKFREDLYYRLSTVQINVPPLRDRGDDIILLSRLFLRNFITENRTGEVTLTDDAQRLLKSYHWPGNVRQLKSVIEQVALFEAGTTVDAATLSQYMPSSRETALTVQSQPNFDYNAEREQLFTLILSMRAEIEALKKRMDGVGTTSHVSTCSTSLKNWGTLMKCPPWMWRARLSRPLTRLNARRLRMPCAATAVAASSPPRSSTSRSAPYTAKSSNTTWNGSETAYSHLDARYRRPGLGGLHTQIHPQRCVHRL